jgi:hypothetical protein
MLSEQKLFVVVQAKPTEEPSDVIHIRLNVCLNALIAADSILVTILALFKLTDLNRITHTLTINLLLYPLCFKTPIFSRNQQ